MTRALNTSWIASASKPPKRRPHTERVGLLQLIPRLQAWAGSPLVSGWAKPPTPARLPPASGQASDDATALHPRRNGGGRGRGGLPLLLARGWLPGCPSSDCSRAPGWTNKSTLISHIDSRLAGTLQGTVPPQWFQEHRRQRCTVCGLSVSVLRGASDMPACRPCCSRRRNPPRRRCRHPLPQ